jgi:hypothetical protein
VTQAELRALLLDCVALWGIDAKVAVASAGIAITADGATYCVEPAPPDMRPVRWLLQTPERRAANRPPRAIPSIVALLSALRNALGGKGGAALRVGAGGA